MRRWREEHTLVKRQSWGPSNDGGLRMVTGNHNPRPTPRGWKTDTFIVFYLFVLHSVKCLKTCHFTACFYVTMNIFSPVFYAKTARDVVTVLFIFDKCLSLYLHIFTCTYRGTHTQAHMYNQHTRGMATTGT